MREPQRSGRKRRTTILLEDLDPEKDVRGGAGKRIFGEQAEPLEAPAEPGRRSRRGPAVEGPATKKTVQ